MKQSRLMSSLCLLLISSLLATTLGSCKSTSSDPLAEFRDFMQMQLWIDWYVPGGDYTGLVNLEGGPGFDPERKTIIHFAGWSVGRGQKGRYFKTNYAKDLGPDLHVTDVWLDRGWNFAVADWTQFSDEKDLRNAEAKIWTTGGPSRTRWMNANGQWLDGPNQTVAQLIADRLEPQLAALKNDDVIFMGHSFGSQLAIAVAYELEQKRRSNPQIKMPKELVLSDPVFTAGKKSYFNDRRSMDLALEKARELSQLGIALSLYKCAAITYQAFFVEDPNQLADADVLTIESDYKDIPILDLDKRHKACKWKYLMSIEQENALIDGKEARAGIAIQDRSLVREMAQQKYRLKLVEQVNGRFSYQKIKR